MNLYNLRLLDEFCEETIPKLLIIDHLLYVNATKLNQGSNKDKKDKHVTFDLNESVQSEPGPTQQVFPINMKQHGKEILKIQSHMRGKLARDEAKLLQERRWRFLFVNTFKQDDQWIKFRLVERIDSGVFYATALNIMKNKTFNRLEIPEILVASLRKQYVNLIHKIEFDLEHSTMNFLPAVEVKLFPETRQKHIKRIEDTTVIKIQKHMRRYIAQQWFKLRLKKHRENPNTVLLRKYPLLEGKHLFTCRVYFNNDQKIITVTAKCEDYIAEIRPLILSLREVDRHQFNDTVSNLKRLADIISPYVTIEYNKHDVYVLGFDKREFERNGRRLEAQLQSYTDLDILGLHNGMENGEETRTKVWQYLQDKSFIEANKHIIMNVLGIQNVRETIKIIEDQEPGIKNLGENENAAARKIQKFYRKILLQRYLKNQSENPKQISIRESASLILANSIRGRSYSLFCEAYNRMVITEEELRRQSTSDRLFLKTIPCIQFSNTNLEARAHVFQNKQESKDKAFDVEVIVPIIGLHDHILIAESDISNTSLKPTTLIKKIDELLINRLGYNPVTKRVYFSKDLVNNKGADGEETGVHKLKISPYIQAKLTRLKYLRRRARTKDMTLIKMQTEEIDRTYVNMSYYWYQPRRQLRIMVEQIDALQHYKEIIIKFDNIQTTSELRGLINDMNTEPKEFIEKMKPYLNYIAGHIVLQPESKVRNVATAREFKILMDSSIFNLEFANTRFVLASLKEIPIETLNNILLKAQQVDIKFLLRSNKMIDIQQFEKMFNNKLNLDDLLNDKPKDESKVKRESEQADSKIPTLNMDSLFMKGATQEEQAEKARKKTREELEAAAQLIQGKFRKYKDQDKFKLMRISKELGKRALEGYGKKIKKTVKKIENHYWTIHVYRKVQAEKNMTLYYFSAVSVKEGPGATRTHAKGMYRADNMLLINSAGKGLIDFLIERMEINGQTIEFNLNLDQTNNYVKLETPEPKRIERDQEEDEVQYGSQTNSARSFTGDQGVEDVPTATAPENKTRKVPKIAIKPNHRSSKKLHTIAEETVPGEGKTPGEEGKDENETPTPTPESTLLQQKAESLLNTLLLYNVYYNQEEEEGDSADKPTLKPLDGITSPTGRNDGAENVIKISVEMEELKKYVPNLSVKNSQDLKVIAAELANSIQINEKGEVMVNSTKINPSALSVTEKKLSIQENPDNKPSKDKNNKKKVLFKMTKAYGDKKYLVLINYIEKLSTINGVMSLAGREDDKVYEDFELFIEVSAVCLSHSAIKPLVWELALQEAQKLSGLTNTAKIAKFFANNIHVFGDQLLLSTPFNYYVNEKNVMIMNENAIKMIQNRFRTRKFTKNFIRFKETLIALKQKSPERAIINLNNVSYNVLGYEKSPTELEIMTWDLTNYEKHSIMMKRSVVEKIYTRDRRRAYHFIFKFLTFEFNNKKEYILSLREKNMVEYLQKEGEM